MILFCITFNNMIKKYQYCSKVCLKFTLSAYILPLVFQCVSIHHKKYRQGLNAQRPSAA